jgi:UDP-arabinose 4-epimerase
VNILVTGGAGYIGSHTCKALARAGHVPITLDNLSRGHEWAVKWGPFEKGDIADVKRVREVLRTHKPAAVIHFAANSYAGESVTHPQLYYGNNIVGSFALIEALRAEGGLPMVFSSSCAVYGDAGDAPMTEQLPFAPVSPYGFSKFAIERMLADYGRAHGQRAICLRYFNAAGGDPDGETGESHDPETHLIPLVLEAAAGKRKQIDVYGNDYPTPDGTCIRDYIHVSDLADAHVRAVERLLDPRFRGDDKTAFNLGTGTGYSVAEVIAAAERVTGKKIPQVMKPRREGDPARAVADASLAHRQLGWKAKYGLDDMIRHAWAWMQKVR